MNGGGALESTPVAAMRVGAVGKLHNMHKVIVMSISCLENKMRVRPSFTALAAMKWLTLAGRVLAVRVLGAPR